VKANEGTSEEFEDEAVTAVVFLDARWGGRDLATYYAGQRANPDGWHDAVQRLMQAPAFILGPPGSGWGWVEQMLLHSWRGHLIDEVLLTHMRAWCGTVTVGVAAERKEALMQVMIAYQGCIAGTVIQAPCAFQYPVDVVSPAITGQSRG
jgi:hypothetical protein